MPDREQELQAKLIAITECFNKDGRKQPWVDSITPKVKAALQLIGTNYAMQDIASLLLHGVQPFDYFTEHERQLIRGYDAINESAWGSFNSTKSLMIEASQSSTVPPKIRSCLTDIVSVWDDFSELIKKSNRQQRALLLKPKASIRIKSDYYYIDMNVARRLLGMDLFGFKAETEAYGHSNTVRYNDMYFKEPMNELDENYVYALSACIEKPGHSPLIARTYVEIVGVRVKKIEANKQVTLQSKEAYGRLSEAIFNRQEVEKYLEAHPGDRRSLVYTAEIKNVFLRVSLNAGNGILLEHVFAAIDAYKILKTHIPHQDLLDEGVYALLTASSPLSSQTASLRELVFQDDNTFAINAAKALHNLIINQAPPVQAKTGSRRGSRRSSRKGSRSNKTLAKRAFCDIPLEKMKTEEDITTLLMTIIESGCRDRIEALLSILSRYPDKFIYADLSFYTLLNSFYGLAIIPILMPATSPQIVFNTIEQYLNQAWSPLNRDSIILLSSLVGFSDMKADNVILMPCDNSFKLMIIDYDAIARNEFYERHGDHYPEVRLVWPAIEGYLLQVFCDEFKNYFRSLYLRGCFTRFLCELAQFRIEFAPWLKCNDNYQIRSDLYTLLTEFQSLFKVDQVIDHRAIILRCFSRAYNHYSVCLAKQTPLLLKFQSRIFDGRFVASLKSICPDLNFNEDAAVNARKSTIEDLTISFVHHPHDAAFSRVEASAIDELLSTLGIECQRSLFNISNKNRWKRLTYILSSQSSDLASQLESYRLDN